MFLGVKEMSPLSEPGEVGEGGQGVREDCLEAEVAVSVCVLQELVEYTTSATRSRRASSSWTPRSSTPTSHGNAWPLGPPAGPQVTPVRGRLPVGCTDLGQEPLPYSHPREQWPRPPSPSPAPS